MPGFDQTGPRGAGPMTGRGMGRCQPQNRTTEESIAEPGPGGIVYGLGRGGVPRGGGGGRGRGTRFGNFRR
jgi:hypothetical protein